MSKHAGRLKYFIKSWEALTSDTTILQFIKGYKIPFSRKVVQFHVPKIKNFSEKEIIDYKLVIQKLLDCGAISRCEPVKGQFLSPYFLREKPNGDKRFILNLKKLNEFIDPPHFKMENIKTVMSLVSIDDYMATLDMLDAFMMIAIHEIFKKYLRFLFQNQLYEFNCLPFGLNVSPYVFTKLLKPVINYLRAKGYKSVFYLDDIYLLGKTVKECNENVSTTMDLLLSLGFLFNKKCELKPEKIQKFLGFILNSERMILTLPEEKIHKVTKFSKYFLTKDKFKIREFAKFIGTLISICPATKYGWLYVKLLEREKFLALRKFNNNYDKSMSISEECKKDIKWWKTNVENVSAPIKRSNYVLTVFSDASLTGWGASCEDNKTHGWWNNKESSLHINELELIAAFYALKCYAKDYENCEILLRIDNTTAISYINRMGGIQFPNLNKIARKIWQWCESKNLIIFASYIKSKENVIADKESRVLTIETEWELNQNQFNMLKSRFGKFDIDLFATNINKKCEKFVSWHRDPESFVVDAFTIRWHQYYFYAFPPFSLILRVLNKIINDKATGVLIVPHWPTQSWYPLFKSLLMETPIYLSPKSDLLLSPFREPHPLCDKLTLVAGKLYGGLSK